MKALEKNEAIDWLKRNISSPVTSIWGMLLVSLSADWPEIKEWMSIGKEHAVASVDAIEHYITTREEWPKGGSEEEILSELERLRSLYPTPKFKQAYDEAARFANPPPLSKKLASAAKILFGDANPNVVLRDRSSDAKWVSLLYKADKKYCLSISDWKTTTDELIRELSSLPIVAQSENNSLIFESLDIGGDEIILIALPFESLSALKRISPSFFKFNTTELRPNKGNS